MGLWWSRLVSLFGDQEARILVLGLDNAGKTTILCAHPRLSLPMPPPRGAGQAGQLRVDSDATRRVQTACKWARSSLPSPVSLSFHPLTFLALAHVHHL